TDQIKCQASPHQVVLRHRVTREDEVGQCVTRGTHGRRKFAVRAEDRIAACRLSFPVLVCDSIVEGRARLVESRGNCDKAVEFQMTEHDARREGRAESYGYNVGK